jgi:eukaryotic-like serine/threonine-protein kinase
MAASVPRPSDPARDQLLADLLATFTEDVCHGRQPDLDAAAAQHPEVADELRQLWATVQFAQQFTRAKPSLAPTISHNPASTQAMVSPATPARVFGEYEILGELGRGGMGVVYKAWQRSLNRMVALKMILRGELATPADLARFQVEAEAAAHLQHPSIVAVHEAGACAGQAYFSMQYIEGQTLGSLLAAGPLRPREAVRLLALVSRAVDFAHRKGILHRDLKPSNVLIDKEGQPHVTDFGLAKRTETRGGPLAPPNNTRGVNVRTQTGAIVGTPSYMAPEQISGSRGSPSPASDVYSLGVILYEMLTGRPPFQAPTPIDTLLLVLDQDPVRPRLLNPNVDPDLELICLKCLQKEPDLRYRSAGDLAADLEAFLHGDTLSVRGRGMRDFFSLFTRMFRETPNAVVLENWGKLWMGHSVMIFLLCFLTNYLHWRMVANPVWYLLLWGGGLIVWGFFFWKMRQWGGPVLFVEKQVAHVWGGAIVATIAVFVVEILLDLPVLKLSPLLAVIAGIVFTVKAGMLSGSFYISAALLFLTAVPMALFPEYGPLLFGMVTAVCFFVPGLKYHRQRLRSLRAQPAGQACQPDTSGWKA